MGEDGPASDKSTRIYQKMKEAADDFVYHNFMLAFLIEKVAHRGNTAVESLRDDRDDRRKREDRKKDEGPKDRVRASSSKRDRSCGRSRDRRRRSPTRARDIERL